MDNNERDQLITRLLGEGHSLSEVQKILQEEYSLQITYMDLRLISSELDVNWEKCDKNQEAKTVNKVIEKNESTPEADWGSNGESKTIVNVSKVVRPGAVMSGDVRFKSGATAEWQLDPIGRLGLNPTGDSEKPSEEDLQDFQIELQKSLQGKF